jgi:hypothetical protein
MEFTSDKDLKIVPSKTSSQNDFDFLIGRHRVHHKKLKTRLNRCIEWIEFVGSQEMRPLLTGKGNVDRYFMTNTDEKPTEGVAFRLFNPKTRLWSIYWADDINGRLEPPVEGSFEDNKGYFFGKDVFNGQQILVKFEWDITDRQRPVWSQSFSPDMGKTWETNWYMYFSKEGSVANETIKESTRLNNALVANQSIEVLELRNYVHKTGQRDKFIDFFEDNFTFAQSKLGGFVLGMFRVKGAEDNFFWMRGFKDMASRSAYLSAFYYSHYWKKRRNVANDLLVNNDNVYLLKPLQISDEINNTSINSNEFGVGKSLAIIDYYIANTRLKELTNFFKEKYIPFLKANAITDQTLWVSELRENDFPALPVFQDKNLLVTITFYKDEQEYSEKMEDLNSNQELKQQLKAIVTTQNTLILFPTANSFRLK